MRRWSLLGALMICILPVIPAWAEDKAIEDRVKKLEEAVQQFKEHERREREPGLPSEPPSEPGIGPLPEVGKERRRDTKAPLSFGSSGSGRLVYAKPFVTSPKAIVGGYFDIQYRSHRKGVIETGGFGNGTTNGFDQTRFVPFIYADITEHVKFTAELEIEHGIREVSDNEISLEFAHMDYLVNEPVNIRAGILLIPIGKFNLLHDSPLNDLTDRPFVSQLVIPTTFPETGAGIYGTFYPTRLSKLDYELYVTTGPCGYDTDGTPRISEQNGTRNALQRKCPTEDGFDINNGKAVVGRMAFSPVLGVEVAGSGYYGNSSPAFSSSYTPRSEERRVGK